MTIGKNHAVRASRSVLVTAVAAVLVTVAGMVYAFLQRPSTGDGGRGVGAELKCGTTVCQSVIGRGVGSDHVELLLGVGGGRIKISSDSGAVVIFEISIMAAGAEVKGADALQCVQGPESVCLVRGTLDGEVVGETLVWRKGTWERVTTTYVSSGAYLALHDVDSNGIADVVAVKLACDGQCDTAYVQAFKPTGAPLGCSAPVAKDKVNRTPASAELRPCAES